MFPLQFPWARHTLRDVSADTGCLCDKRYHVRGKDKMDTLYYEGICLRETSPRTLGPGRHNKWAPPE
jgi:hypothetical protein